MTEWTMELGHMAIFGGSGGSGELRDPETEQEIYEHILQQQEAEEAAEAEPAEAAAETRSMEQDELGVLEIRNYYTGSVTAEMQMWLVDEGHRHEHFDAPANVERRGKFLGFAGWRDKDGSRFRVHIELDDTVEETLRVLGACAYKGEVPGPAMEFEVELERLTGLPMYLPGWDAGSMTWRQILEMNNPTKVNIIMSMRNPHAVVVSAYTSGVALATNRTILKKIEKQ